MLPLQQMKISKNNNFMSNNLRIKRNVNGVFLLNKPLNISSNAALQMVKHIFAARKAGHTGSLDVLATGMLPICFGEATKFSQFLLDADKRYLTIAKLGVTTTTGDAEGEIVQQNPVPTFNEIQLDKVLAKFRGEISQIPSMYSALKYQGRPLYELARQGITVERAARMVNIYELMLKAHTKDTLTLEVNCSKGTYIRTLVEDIGNALGCGAHVIELHRLTAGGYEEDKMLSFSHLQQLVADHPGNYAVLDQLLLPIDSMLQHWPSIKLSEAATFYVERGQPIIIPQAPTSGWVRLYHQDKFIGAGEILDDGRVAPRRLISERINT